ncbi:DUF3310 domain-containing protein [Staphylococcus pseudintermedius]|uniref:DUF3310 domain-containing protein n=1 Tax=Staphylococcus pseudintermedius TaxID=283734 RepID=UPI001654FE58|nr:DUF3310 domain-containing protein [Staphylococcus pseudintermedius]EJG0135961.1 DUF3310 domain-containing protein [Staphylococcus pseudintermedius]EJG5544098.1 DUF3310 domain-containing protein [Staphylococcus pseudintermedius]MBC8669033.1 DUF3310 domain-containing protein [Staphylococcus pseudintermedius]MCE5466577.1 DUF3310 domain-containing protein [Staphylococcus pseudintermedius]HAR6158559.1 DUF3310 domain-containing protein [Staphylococcus pseudintermedius]
MEIKDLKIGDKVSVEVGSQQFKDTDDDKWVYETIFGTAEVTKVNETYEYANVIFGNGTYGEINADVEWYPIPSNTKIATHETSEINKPHHYMFEDGTEAIKIINMIVKRYKQSIVAAQIYNAIKYIVRAPFKNGVKDLKKAKESINFAIKFWDDKEMEYENDR